MLKKTRIRTIYRLSAGSDGLASARQIVLRELGYAYSGEAVESAGLLLGELVSERQSHLQPEFRLMVDVLHASRDHDRWCVIDRGAPSLPAGMRSVALDALTDAWGVSRRQGLTRTWFELRASA